MTLLYYCPECRETVQPDARTRHQMQWCGCKGLGIDAEEYYTRVIGTAERCWLAEKFDPARIPEGTLTPASVVWSQYDIPEDVEKPIEASRLYMPPEAQGEMRAWIVKNCRRFRSRSGGRLTQRAMKRAIGWAVLDVFPRDYEL